MQRSLRLRALTVLALALAVGAAQGRPVLIAPKPTVGATSQNARARWERRPAEELEARLNADTGLRWLVTVGDHRVRMLVPGFAGPGPQLPGDTPEQKARLFFDKYRMYLHGTGDPSELRVRVSQQDKDGRYFMRFDHYLPGTEIRVTSQSTFELAKDGSFHLGFSGFRKDIGTVPRKAQVDADTATQRAMAAVASYCKVDPAAVTPYTTELVAYGWDSQPLRLVWRIPVYAGEGHCIAPEALVDAITGAVVSVDETAQS